MLKRTILIAEDDAELATFLTAECRKLGFEVFRSPDAMHALLGAHRVQPALMILDLNMPGGNGLSVCEMLASDRAVSHIPVIIMSGQSDPDTIRRCRLAGARYVCKGTNLWNELVAAMCQCLSGEPLAASPDVPLAASVDEPLAASVDAPLAASVDAPLAASSGEPGPPPVPPPSLPTAQGKECSATLPKIISIDDDPEISAVLKLRLEPYGVEVFRAFSGMHGYWTCLDLLPDVIISDLNMNDGDGGYLLHRLRTHSLTEKTPVIILTGQTNPAVRRQLLSQGAAAYLTKPFVMDELLEQLRPLVALAAVPTAFS